MKKIVGFLIFLMSITFSVSAIDKIELSESDRKDALKLMQNIRKKIEKEEKEKALELKKRQKEEEKRQKEEARQRELEEKEAEKKLREKQAATGQGAKEVMAEQAEGEGVSDSAQVMPNEVENVMVEEAKNADKKSPLEEYLKDKKRMEKEKKAQIKTPMQKLEATQKLANEKVDFYERVTRSVAREEKEVKEYKEILDLDI